MITIDEFNEKYRIEKLSETTDKLKIHKSKNNTLDIINIGTTQHVQSYVIIDQKTNTEISIINAKDDNELLKLLVKTFKIHI